MKRIGIGLPACGIIALAVACAVFVWARPSAAELAPGDKLDVDQALLDDLVTANRILAHQGVLDGFGHISVRNPKNANHYLMSRWVAPGLVARDDIVEFDLDSKPLTQKDQHFYSERYIHGEIYKVRPDVMAIVHSHSPTVVPFSISNTKLVPVLHNAAFLGTDVPNFDIRTKFGDTDMLVNRMERGTELARVLGGHTVVLMRGHGDTVVGPDLQTVVWRAHYTEVNARMQAQAISLGGGVVSLDAGETKLTDESMLRVVARPWALWKAEAMGAPDGDK